MTEVATVSWTALSRHFSRKGRPSGTAAGMACGRAVDAALRCWLANPSRPMREYLSDRLPSAYAQANAEKATEVLEPYLTEHVLGYPHLAGHRFVTPEIDLDGRVIQLVGEVDLLGGRVPTIYELKVTADESYWGSAAAQLAFYGLALQMCGQRREQLIVLQPLCEQMAVPVQLDQDALWGPISQYAATL